jgi:hypothetical protein
MGTGRFFLRDLMQLTCDESWRLFLEADCGFLGGGQYLPGHSCKFGVSPP